MIKTIKGMLPSWYTLKSDSSNETTFLLNPLTSAQRLNIIGVNSKDMLGDTILLVCKTAVQDFKGVTDEAGTPVAFSRDALERLPAYVLAELSREIMDISSLNGEQAKN